MQESVGETSGTSKVVFRGQVDTFISGDLDEQIPDSLLSAVIHNNDPVHRVALGCNNSEGGAEKIGAVVGDDDGGDGRVVVKRHDCYCRTGDRAVWRGRCV